MRIQKFNRAELLAFCAIAISTLTLVVSVLVPGRQHSEVQERVHVQNDEPEVPLQAAGSILSLDELSAASAAVAKLAASSVVRVEASLGGAPAANGDLESYFGRLPDERLGSGVVVDAGGFVVTNYHVVRGADQVSLVDGTGKIHRAELVGHDSLTDFALLRAPDLKAPSIQWADSDQVEPGQFVWAIGNPYGLDQSVSMGIVSSTNRPTMLDSPFQDFLQTDASVNPGNSGGALVDLHGRLIGINTAIAGDSFQGISFALPSNTARQVIDQLKSTGQIPRGWIGVQLGSVTASRAALAGMRDGKGAFVESLSTGDSSPAQAAGLRVGDIIVTFDGQPVSGPLSLLRQIARHPINTSAGLTVIRKGQEMKLEVDVIQRP